MPELPEVETIRRQLARVLIGKTIRNAEVIFGQKINMPAKKFTALVRGVCITGIKRRAKILIWNLSNGVSLLMHLKMTGRLMYVASAVKPTKHTHAIFYFSGNKKILWEDVRRFGYIKVVPTNQLDNFFKKEDFGPEPLDGNFNVKVFRACIHASSRKKIKPLLMDQTCVAGIGNIYADEGLWYAGILPTRKAGSLIDGETRILYNGLRKILRNALTYGGSSADTYVDVFGKKGKYVPFLNVYNRQGEPCRRHDGGVIKKIRLGGRGAHYCPVHQK